ncbi:MAG: DUF3883 domain-containing protein [Candidatus Woesearchaeota archaeon]
MADKNKLRYEQAKWEGTRQELEKKYKLLSKKRDKFIKLFPIDKIELLKKEEYCLQKGKNESKNSFCYWLENELVELGNIHGSTAVKFGIYYGQTKSDSELKYRINHRFGDSIDEVFVNIKKSIVDLLKAGETKNLQELIENPISPMFKGKLLSTYFPNSYLNIFGKEHLEHFLLNLDIEYNSKTDEVELREILLGFKKEDSVMSKWNIYDFSNFLYAIFGHPIKGKVTPELEPYFDRQEDYPDMKFVKSEYVDLNINTSNILPKTEVMIPLNKTFDYDEEKYKKILGNRGEEIVYAKEKQYLISIGRKDLSEKVILLSKKDDSLGYDILSFEENGDEKYIEVKSTSNSINSNANFLISSNQYHKAKKIKNYYFYVVFSAKSKFPKIWRLKNPLSYENRGLTLTPVNYRVIINTKI